MIKPPILSELPNLSSTKETQLILKVTDCATGDVLAQESKAIKLYSIYDYKTTAMSSVSCRTIICSPG